MYHTNTRHEEENWLAGVARDETRKAYHMTNLQESSVIVKRRAPSREERQAQHRQSVYTRNLLATVVCVGLAVLSFFC